MTASSPTRSQTLLDAIKTSFASATRAPEGVAEPVALLWTDAENQWSGLMPALRELIPELYSLGAYYPESRIGPAIWLKCIVDRALLSVSPALGTIPILYLGGVSRQQLRAGGDCPNALQPLIELQYRGAMWHQRNGRDWTVESFLVSEAGLGLDMSQDIRTREAMLRSLPVLATEPIEHLRGRRLDAEDFDRLSISDPIRDLLLWMSDSKGFEHQCEPTRWQAFRDVSSREFGLDLAEDLPSKAAIAISKGGGNWDLVWRRFADAPSLYPGIGSLLRIPECFIPLELSRSPAFNEEQERRLRSDLEGITALPHKQACEQLLALEKQHGMRRDWVWARLAESPLALALGPLSGLADLAKSPLGGTSIGHVVSEYVAQAWRCDSAALEALAITCSPSDAAIVGKVVRALYQPWLDLSARHFQQLIPGEEASFREKITGVSASKDTCILFVDGLRFDIGEMVRDTLESRGFKVKLSHRLAPLPTVTATAKPMASPAHRSCKGGSSGDDFTPVMIDGAQPAIIKRLREDMVRLGLQIVDSAETGEPFDNRMGGWTEIGQLDELGHKLGTRLAGQIRFEVEAIADRVSNLLTAGWRRIQVVTDHGWLLLPGGLPKITLPPYLVATKWSRCATVIGQSTPDVPTFHWYWNSDIRIASPPGIGSFMADTEYAHGGVSPQECVIPELMIEFSDQPIRSKIVGVSWRGMRCRINVETNSPGAISVDIRLSWRNPDSSIAASIRTVSESGEASVVIDEDKYEGSAATVVLLDDTGNVIDYQPTTVGEDKK